MKCKTIEEVASIIPDKNIEIDSICAVYVKLPLNAARALRTNALPNRDIKPGVVKSYMDAYKANKWDEFGTTAPIMITRDYRLAAGQHRIEMQCKLEIPVMIHPCVFDASPAQIALQDTNANRTNKDKVEQIFNGEGGMPKITVITKRSLVAAAKILETDAFFQNNPGKKTFQQSDPINTADMLKTYQESFVKASNFIAEDATTTVFKCAAILAGVAYCYKHNIIAENKLNEIAKKLNYCDQDPNLNNVHDLFQTRGACSNPKAQHTLFTKIVDCIKSM